MSLCARGTCSFHSPLYLWLEERARRELEERCTDVADGGQDRYYEWLKKGRDKIPHFTRHKEPERLLLLAGLYDSVVLTGTPSFPSF